MSKGMIEVGPDLYDYICGVTLRESDLQRRLREETNAEVPMPGMSTWSCPV